MQRRLHSRSSEGLQKRKNVIHGSRDPKSRLWRVNLKQKIGACFSPVKSTWIKAIKDGNFSSWPGLHEHTVEKHLSKSTSTAKGHLNQQRQISRTTKIKDAQ
jgi:hypothetical protein